MTTKLELIHVLGDVMTELDKLGSQLDYKSTDPAEVKAIDSLRDVIDAYQLKLVKTTIDEGNKIFQQHTASLLEVNAELTTTIADVKQVAKTIGALANLIGAIAKIVAFI